MTHLKLYTTAILLAGLAACNGNDASTSTEEKRDSTLLSTDLVNNPRSAAAPDAVAVGEMPTIDFKDTMHHFGNIKEGEVVLYDFEFTNNGKAPLVIASASGSCGCTVPTYPSEPVQPGKTGVMKVRFDSHGKTGHQEKSVTVKSNAARGDQMLFIVAEVAEAKK